MAGERKSPATREESQPIIRREGILRHTMYNSRKLAGTIISTAPSLVQQSDLNGDSINIVPAPPKPSDVRQRNLNHKPYVKTRIQNDIRQINQELKSGSVNLVPDTDQSARTRNDLQPGSLPPAPLLQTESDLKPKKDNLNLAALSHKKDEELVAVSVNVLNSVDGQDSPAKM